MSGAGSGRHGLRHRRQLGAQLCERRLVALLDLAGEVLPSHPALGLLQLEHAELFLGLLVPVLDFRDALVAFLQLGIDGRVVDLVALDGLVDVPDLCVHARQGLLAFLDLAPGGVGPFDFLADIQRELIQAPYAVGLELPQPPQAGGAVFEPGVEGGHLELVVDDLLVDLLEAGGKIGDPVGAFGHDLLGRLDLGGDARQGALGLAHLVVQVARFAQQLLLLELGDLQLPAQALQLLGRLVDGLFGLDLVFAALVLLLDQFLQLHVEVAELGFDGALLEAGALQFLFERLALAFEFPQFVLLCQDAAGGVLAAADQKPPGRHHVAVAGDNGLDLAVLVEQGDRFGERFGQHHVAEQGLGNGFKARLHHDVLQEQLGRIGPLRAAGRRVVQCRGGDEPAAAGALLLEVADRRQSRLLVVHDDVLEGLAQCRLHGGGGRGFRLDHVGHQADDTRQRAAVAALLGAFHHGLDAVLVPLEVVFHLFKRGMLRSGGAAFELDTLGQFHLGGEGPGLFIQPFADVVDAAAQLRDGVLDRREPRLGAGLALLRLGDLLVQKGLCFIRALEPPLQVFAVVGGVLVEVPVLGLTGREVQQAGPGALQLLVHAGERRGHPLQGGALLLEAGAAAPDLLPQPGVFRFALLDLRQHALVFLLQPLAGVLQVGGFTVKPLDLAAQVLEVLLHAVDGALDVELLGLLVGDRLVFLPALELDLLDGRIELLQLGGMPDVGVLEPLQHLVGAVDLAGELLEVVQPQADIEPLRARLVFAEELGLAGLPLQAVHLALDFDDDVGHPQQVLVGDVDLAQGFGLVMLVAGDAGGLFDEIPALLRAGLGDDADVALLDERVGPRAETAAEEDVVDVLEAAGLLVEKVGAFTGPVEAAGHVDLGEIL